MIETTYSGGADMGGSTTTTSSQTSQVPQHIVDTGKSLFTTAQNYLSSSGSGGQYPTFDPTKDLAQGLNQTAGFTNDQLKSFDIGRANVGSQAPAMGAAFQLAGQAAQPVGYDSSGNFLGTVNQNTSMSYANPYAFQNVGTDANGNFAGNISPGTAAANANPYNFQSVGNDANGNFAGGINGSDIASAMNPYTQEVTNRGLADMNRSYMQDQNRLTSDAINGGAAWGSQARNQGDQLAERYYKSAGDYSAQQNAAGYNNAVSLAQQRFQNLTNTQESNRASQVQGYNTGLQAGQQNFQNLTNTQDSNRAAQMAGYNTGTAVGQQNWQNYYGTAADNRSSAASLASLYPQLAAQGKALDSQDSQTLYAQGASQQALNQQAIDTARNNQLNAYQYPLDQLNTLSSLNVMQPYSKTVNTTNTQSSQPGLGQIIGTGIGAGSVLFGGGGLFSDEDMKENITKAKMTPKQALAAFVAMPVKDWNYTDEAQEKYDLPSKRTTGPMAQDYEKHLGSSMDGPDGDQMVDIADTLGKMTLAIKELANRTKKAA
jgi:hypothetical protein